MWEYFKTKTIKKQFKYFTYSDYFILMFAIRNIIVYINCVMNLDNNINIHLEPYK